MAEQEERVVCGLRIQIDRRLCVGFEDCASAAPEVFRMDQGGIVTFTEQPEEMRDRLRLIQACQVCPVDALTAIDEKGSTLAP
jgi:ferredoxin